MKDIKLNQSSTDFSHLFQDKVFSVPPFQRGFDWEKRNLQDLWDDIFRILEQHDREHYMDSIVIHSIGEEYKDTAGNIYESYRIIDGQQRIISLILLLISIFKQIKDVDLKNGMKRHYFFIKMSNQGRFCQKLPKLILDDDNYDFMKSIILQNVGELDHEIQTPSTSSSGLQSPSLASTSTLCPIKNQSTSSRGIKGKTLSVQKGKRKKSRSVKEEMVSNTNNINIASHKRIRYALQFFENQMYETREKFKNVENIPKIILETVRMDSLEGNEISNEQTFETFLEILYQKITTSLMFGLVIINDEDDAYQMFEVLNNRGKPLSEMEKIKNYFIYLCSIHNLGHSLEIDVVKTWSNMFKTLNQFMIFSVEYEDRFMTSIVLPVLGISYGNYDSIKKYFEGLAGRDVIQAELTRLLELMRHLIVAYCSIERPDLEISFLDVEQEIVKKDIRRLFLLLKQRGRLLHYYFLSVHFYLINIIQDKTLYGPILLKIVSLVEKWTFCTYDLKRRRKNMGTKLFSNMSQNLYKAASQEMKYSPSNTLQDIYNDMTVKQKLDQNTIKNLLSKLSYLVDEKTMRYILYEYEYSLNPLFLPKKKNQKIGIVKIHSEDNYTMNPKKHKISLNSFGNLTITHLVSPGNTEYEDMLDLFKEEGSYEMEKQIANLFPSRNMKSITKSIMKRNRIIIDFAVKRYSVSEEEILIDVNKIKSEYQETQERDNVDMTLINEQQCIDEMDEDQNHTINLNNGDEEDEDDDLSSMNSVPRNLHDSPVTSPKETERKYSALGPSNQSISLDNTPKRSINQGKKKKKIIERIVIEDSDDESQVKEVTDENEIKQMKSKTTITNRKRHRGEEGEVIGKGGETKKNRNKTKGSNTK